MKKFIDKANPYCELKMKLMNPKENIDTFSRINIQMEKKSVQFRKSIKDSSWLKGICFNKNLLNLKKSMLGY